MGFEEDVKFYQTMSDNVKAADEKVHIQSMAGDVEARNCTGHIQSMSGNVNINGGEIYSVKTMSGDIYVTNGKVQCVETLSGTLILEDSIVDEFKGYNIEGNGTIDYVELPNFIGQHDKFNIFKPSTWFRFTISYENVIIVNGKVIHDKSIGKPINFHVPPFVKINKIKTDGKVYSKYPIEIIGKGELILE